ncbi:MAG TPA: hypothetical protein VFW19_09640 [Allosphingosinicella sp.]|nr:hypothetical protein [Allosphingosinicella sp.]
MTRDNGVVTNAAPRIFFDSNVGSHANGYWLVLDLSLRDLAAIPDLRDGMEVILHMPDELEMRATLRRGGLEDSRPWDFGGFWIADPIEGTVRDLS